MVIIFCTVFGDRRAKRHKKLLLISYQHKNVSMSTIIISTINERQLENLVRFWTDHFMINSRKEIYQNRFIKKK